MNTDKLREDWFKKFGGVAIDGMEKEIADYWLNILSLREQELWDKLEEAKMNIEQSDFIKSISDIQLLLTTKK